MHREIFAGITLGLDTVAIVTNAVEGPHDGCRHDIGDQRG